MYLIKNLSKLLTMNRDKIYSHVDLLIEDNIVKRIRPAGMIKRETGVEVIDGNGKIGLPGFINTHSHSTQFFLGNCLREMSIFKWLRVLNRIYRRIDKRILIESTLLHYLNMLRQGVTYVFDMELSPEPIYNAAKNIGLRVNYNMMLFNTPETVGDTVVSVADIKKIIDKYYNKYIGLLDKGVLKKDVVEFSLGPVGFPASDNKLLELVRDYSREYNLRIHTHVGESKHNLSLCKNTCGRSEIENLHKLNLLGDNLHIAHGVWVTEDDIALMSKYDVGLSHNLLSNLYLRVGLAQLYSYRRYGVKIGIGMDGAASNPVQSIFDEMRGIYYVQRSIKQDPVFTAKDIIYMATRVGAEIVGRKDLGFIKEGSKADLILLKINDIKYPYTDDVYYHILFTSNPYGVSEVLINGRLLINEGLLNIDIDYHDSVKFLKESVLSICQELENDII